VANQKSWPRPGWLLYLEHDAEACIPSTSLQYGGVAVAACWHGLNFNRAINQWHKRLEAFKRVSMHMVVTLNTCCDAACLAFKLPHNTTGSFHSHQCLATQVTQHNSLFQSHHRLERNNIGLPSIRRMSSAFHRAVRWHFFRCEGQVHNQGYSSLYSEIT